MDASNSGRRTLQALLMKKPHHSHGNAYKDFDDDTDSMFENDHENQSPKRSTHQGRTNFTKSPLPSNNAYTGIESTQPPQTLGEDPKTQEKDSQEPPPQAEKQEGHKQAGDKQWHMSSWLQKMRPSNFRRKEHATSGRDTSNLMGTSPEMNSDYSTLGGDSGNANVRSPSPRFHRNAMHWSSRNRDDQSTGLLTTNGALMTDDSENT